VRQKFFTVRTIEIWNSLSYEVVNAPTVNTFKNRLDTGQIKKYSMITELL